MPPRRSSRVTSASLETPPIETLPIKRKRGQTLEPHNVDLEEDDDVEAKPKRGKRASSVVKPTRPPRRSSRAVSASLETAPVEPLPIKQKRGQTIQSHILEEEEMKLEEEEEVDSNLKTAATPIDVDEEAPPIPKGRRTTTPKPDASIQQSDDEMDAMSPPSEKEEDEDVKPIRKSRKVPTARKAKVTTKKSIKTTVIDDSDDDSDIQPPPAAQPRSQHNGVASNAAHDAMAAAEEEEERSLFDPPPMPGPSNLPRAVPEEPAGPKSRLVIHKMVLINFKSYAGKQEIGPFHKSFSSIVGPNGSGKSNTIDALLFVFGYRASKMRQGKISELIHISADFPNLDECSVEVHFRDIIDLPGPDAFKVVPNSQLVVTRQAFKNNASRYAINERSSNYTEVQTLLKGRGIDLDHNRFLILQGEVESIAQMKPKAQTEHEDGLLEYLEDIIGTSKYKEPIDEALVETERLQEDRQMKINRLRHVEKEKTALEARKKEAEDYLRLKNDHTKALSRQYQWSLWQSLEREAKLSAQIEKLAKDLSEETEKNKDDVAHLTLLRQHYEEREKTYAEVQAAAALAVKDLTANERQEIALQERRKHADGKAKKHRKSLKEDGAARKTALYTIEDTTAKIKSEKSKHDEYEVSLGEEEKVLEGIQDSLKDKTQVFHDQIQAKQKELQPWTAQINTKQAEIDVATSERDALAKKAQALQAANKEANETLEALQEDLQIKVAKQDELKDEKRKILNGIQVAQKKVKDTQVSVQEWRGKAATNRNKLNEAKANQSEDLSKSKVLKSLTHLKDGGKIDGFHGRLGDLGTIPDKYDVAITTACGGNLDNMVVNEVSEAQACIEHLRRNNVGRASFMVLKKLKSYGMDKIPTPENVPRLFDLVTPNHESYAPAFFKAIGNTLVANDMDQANRIAFGRQRWRVVTLAGGVIETSGAMSGGGSHVSKGGMSSKKAATISPQLLRTYEKDSEDAANRLQEATAYLQEAEMELERLSTRGPEIDMAYQKLSLDIENVKKRITEAEKRVKDLGSQNKPNTGDLARISKLEQEIAKANGALEKLKEQSSRIDQDIKDLEKRILDIGGSKLLSQKSKVDGIRLHISLANEEITKAEVARSKAEKDAAKLETAVNSNTKALEAIEKEIEELDEQIAGLVDYVAKLKENVENAQNAAENSKEDLETLKVELDAKEEQIAAFRQKEMTIKQSLSDKEKENKENDRAITYFQDSHDKLRLEDIDDDEEDEEADEGGSKEQPVKDVDGTVEAEGDVKAEPGTKPQARRQTREGTPSTELHVYTIPELMKFKKDELVAETVYLEEQIKNARPDLTVLKEYKQREQEFFNRAKDLELITAERDAQKAKYDGLGKQRLDEFMFGFNLISLKLKEMYQMITLGGNAELELVDSLDPFSEGIIFSVMPPKKSWKNISNLSGGEKTLSSLALVFALHVFKPTPLYFMDEIDAALDFRNVSIVANYIKDRTKNAQFIIISLRNDMFELSHRLIGIYKTSNATRSISIDNHALQSAIPQHPVAPPQLEPPISQAQISHAQTTLLSTA